ncbi:cytochrome P450 [Kitasatospora purpeofusca]|uniref:cytochrome P450 n=1 Tax=Kitasatospora purpeofusca TaxID=67352 RepID=UPI00369445E2
MTGTEFHRATAPGALPVVGHALRLLRDPLAFVTSLPNYGDLVEIRLGPQKVHAICHPDLLQQVITDDRTFDKGGPLFERLRDFMGNGLATCPHADHRRQRRLVQPAFSRSRLTPYGTVMTRELGSMLEGWRDGAVIDAFPAFSAFTLRTVSRSLFAADLGQDRIETIQQSFVDAFSGALPRMFVPKALQRLPLPGNRRYLNASRTLTATVGGVIAQYRQSVTGHGDLLSVLLAARDEDGNGLSDAEVRDQVVTLLVAGSETTAAVMSWAVAELATHPDAARRLRKETDYVLAGRTATWDDLPHLPYTACVVNEVLRRYPAGWMITRTTSSETQLAGLTLPPGSTVGFSPLILQTRPDYYRMPERFNPDRWLPHATLDMPRIAFAPFGGGARKCIGDAFAVAETTLALASIAARWTWETTAATDLRPALSASVIRPRRVCLRLASRTPERWST